MRPSIVGATYDLIEFQGRGTFGQFDRAFRRACRYLSFHPNDATIGKLRSVALHYLRTTGFLDVMQAERTAVWSVAPPNVVQRGDNDFVLVGGSETARVIQAAARPDQLSTIRSSDIGLIGEDIWFFPEMLRVVAPEADVEALCARVGVSLGRSYQKHFFGALPGIDAVLRQAVEEEELHGAFEPGSTDQFDFASCEWCPFNDPRPVRAGLFRQRFEFGPARFVIAAPSRSQRLAIFRVKTTEWVLIVALALLRAALPARYERQYKRLLVSKRYHAALRLPTLIERSLRSGTLLNPSISREWFTYDGLAPASIACLGRKFPVVAIEERP